MSDMPLDIGERLKQLQRRAALTQEQLAQRMRVNRSTISNWFRGSSLPSNRNVEKLARELNTSPDYILFGETEYDSSVLAGGGLPIFNVDAGYDRWFGDEGYETGSADRFSGHFHSKDLNAFACILRGDSMEPEFGQGIIVLVEPSSDVRARDYVIFSTAEIKSFKQYIPLGQSRVKFHPLNPVYDDLIVRESDIRYCYKVVAQFKEY